MLDSTTKKRIDDARDTLVGKLPDPKSQVEQITIALIYKFMDDMDRASVKLGGKGKFFSGAFKDYAWDKVFDTKLAGLEIVKAYGDAIQQLDKNPNVPQLFRNIFKNAYLPYRDPETLKSFLTIIDEFEYDHSEKLGDAFEYLLSILGSQGELGQFRTPRHIIDFIVEIVNPQKNEKILDPACGTAGFLISGYKHILKHNSKNYSPEKDSKTFALQGVNLNEVVIENKDFPGDRLTSDDRARLVKNIFGYDISPDMIRLSLVNLYLHGFPDPKIAEYDTLTSEDRWNEHADVILANPPFMTPKGGIKPHKRFSVQCNRSEVLFVDYILEHLSPSGRAGIIVPEGIIFNSQNAFRQLRKMMVDKFLVAVVSLPAGVFNPYAGVKTSILVLDKALATKANSVAFFKVENDGFDLGAQRRAIRENDLPQVYTEFQEYLSRLRDGKSIENLNYKSGLIVSKTKIATNGDYSLSGERYREDKIGPNTSRYPIVRIGDICSLIGGSTPSKKHGAYWSNGTIKWISSKHIDTAGNITGYEYITESAVTDRTTRIAPKNSTILITRVSVGKCAFADDNYAINQDLTALVSKDIKRLDPEFVYIIGQKLAVIVEQKALGIGVRGVTRDFLSDIQIPLPPMAMQKQIIAEIKGHRKNIADHQSAIKKEEQKTQTILARIWGESEQASTKLQNKPKVEAKRNT